MKMFFVQDLSTWNHPPFSNEKEYIISDTSFQESPLPIPASILVDGSRMGRRASSEMMMQQSTGHIVNRTLDIVRIQVILRKTQQNGFYIKSHFIYKLKLSKVFTKTLGNNKTKVQIDPNANDACLMFVA